MKRQKSVPEDVTKVEDDSSLTELDFCRTFEEEVCPVFPQIVLVSVAKFILNLTKHLKDINSCKKIH